MVRLCEHKFEAKDPKHEGYSATEVDLFPAVGNTSEAYSVRHNKQSHEYEIFDYTHEEPYTDLAVIYSGPLQDVIQEVNRLEEYATGDSSFEYGHSPGLYDCPEISY